jgi:hypothetical protein
VSVRPDRTASLWSDFVAFAADLLHGKVADNLADQETLGKAVDANHRQAKVEIAAASAALRIAAGHPVSLLDPGPLDSQLAEFESAIESEAFATNRAAGQLRSREQAVTAPWRCPRPHPFLPEQLATSTICFIIGKLVRRSPDGGRPR